MTEGNPYEQLLDATIRELETLQARGVRYLPIAETRWRSLAGEAPRRAPAAQPTINRSSAITSAPRPAPRISLPTLAPTPASPPSIAAAASPAPLPESVVGLQGPVQSREEKIRSLSHLQERASVCVKCAHLASSRNSVVFGEGDPDAALMLIGEAPGAEEDQQSVPFVGRAGQLLTKIIQTMGLTRDQIYISNIVKCRPNTPGQAYGNRKPTSDEIKTCVPYIAAQIEIIRPKILVALGATAIEGLLGAGHTVGKVRGKMQTYKGIPLLPTYHPSYLLKNEALSEKRKVWEDMLQVMEFLKMPISEKQRGYFLR